MKCEIRSEQQGEMKENEKKQIETITGNTGIASGYLSFASRSGEATELLFHIYGTYPSG
jgi:hypothetical protein